MVLPDGNDPPSSRLQLDANPSQLRKRNLFGVYDPLRSGIFLLHREGHSPVMLHTPLLSELVSASMLSHPTRDHIADLNRSVAVATGPVPQAHCSIMMAGLEPTSPCSV